MSENMAPRAPVLPAFLLVVVTVFVLALFDASDPDLGFHLATGRAILDLGRLPTTNVLSFAEPGQTWVLQQGLPGVLFELLYQWGGIAAVIVCKAAIVTTTFVLVFGTALTLGAGPGGAACAVVVAAAACAFRFVERPFIFSNLMLAALAFILAAAARGPRRSGWLALAIAVTALACHLHAGAVFLFILLIATGVGRALDEWQRRGPDRGGGGVHGLRDLWRAPLLLGAVAIGGLVLATATLAIYHPFAFRVLAVPFQMGTDPFLKQHLIEFRNPWAFPLVLTKVYWLFLTLALVSVMRWRRMRFAVVLPVLAFAGFSLWFVRFADAFAIVAGPAVAVLISDLRAWRPLRKPLARFALIGIAAIAIVDRWSIQPPGLSWNRHVYPVELMDFVERYDLRGPTFASDGWAGPYLARFYPREQVFFFPAFDAFSPALVQKYVDIRYGRPGWDAELDRYGIQLLLLKYTSAQERVFQNQQPNLRQHLIADPRWSLVGFDDNGAIFVRADGVNRSQAQTLAITGVDPDIMHSADMTPASLAQLRAARTRGPASTRIDMLIELLDIKEARQRALKRNASIDATPATVGPTENDGEIREPPAVIIK